MSSNREPSYRRDRYPLDNRSDRSEGPYGDDFRFKEFIIIGLELSILIVILVVIIMMLTTMDQFTKILGG